MMSSPFDAALIISKHGTVSVSSIFDAPNSPVVEYK